MRAGLFRSSCSCSGEKPTAQGGDPTRVLLHPELTDHPAGINWVVTSYPRDLARAAEHPSSPLAHLLTAGVLARVTGSSGAIYTQAQKREDWRRIAGQVRRAVEDTVATLQCAGEAGEATGDESLDAALHDIAPQVLERYVRPLAGAHGGKIEITQISGGTVWVYLDGACRGCPAAKFTLQQRFERELDRRLAGARVRESR